eukprot:Em0008g867a
MKVELRPSELNVEKQYKGQQSLKEHVSYSLQVVEDHDLYKRIPSRASLFIWIVHAVGSCLHTSCFDQNPTHA